MRVRRPRYRLVLEASDSDLPADVRVKRALKVLWRSFALRCVGIRQTKSEQRKV